MRFALILIYVFLIFTLGQATQAAVSDDILYDGINSLSGWKNLELYDNDCRITKLAAIDSYTGSANGYLSDDCLFNGWPETDILTTVNGGTKRLGYLDGKGTKREDAGHHLMFARTEISAVDSGRDAELANNPTPSSNYYEEVVAWLKDAYHTWIAKNPYGSTRLLLLSFGLVGIIGIRRKFKKS